MTRGRLAALGALLVLVLGCAIPPQPPDPGLTGRPPGHVVTALADRGLGFAGFVVTPGPLDMALRDSITVTISVCGSQARSAGCTVDSAQPSVAAAPTAAVAPDGLVAAVLTADPSGPGTSTRISSKDAGRQPMSGPAASATWSFLVTPDHLGQYTLTVHLTSQHGFTAVALPEQAITIPLSVHEPRDVAGSSIVDTLFVIALVVAGLAVLTLALFVRASIRRRRRADLGTTDVAPG